MSGLFLGIANTVVSTLNEGSKSLLVFLVDINYLTGVFHKFLVLAGIGFIAAGAMLGIACCWSDGVWAQIGGALVGGMTGLFAALNAMAVVAVFWRVIAGFRRKAAQKEADKNL